HRFCACAAAGSLPPGGLPATDRRPAERRTAVAARLLRDHLDRAALLFQLRADAGHAEHSLRAEAGLIEIYRTKSPVLLPLGRGVHGVDGVAARLVLWRAGPGVDAPVFGAPDRHRHVARADHGLQCLGDHLAEPEEGAGLR